MLTSWNAEACLFLGRYLERHSRTSAVKISYNSESKTAQCQNIKMHIFNNCCIQSYVLVKHTLFVNFGPSQKNFTPH
ncbi:hypothetical protein XENTR_v10018923 [Xenopus tropicalis]|nr:hypothetical protein XENTR_v10018923 [Xenopus tropicalis]